MQTPAGFRMEGGRAVLTSFMEAAFNPSTMVRYVHVVLAAWLTGSLFVAGISAWSLIRDKSKELFRPLLKLSLGIFIVMALAQFISGHWHAVQVARNSPKRWPVSRRSGRREKGAPMSLLGIPDETAGKTHFEIRVPKLLSLMINFDADSEVKGLNEFPKGERPPLALTYLSYHSMLAMGGLFALLSVLGAFFIITGGIYKTRWYLWLLTLASPVPLLANDLGWIAAEVGVSPGGLSCIKTSAAASQSVPLAGSVFMIMFTASIWPADGF